MENEKFVQEEWITKDLKRSGLSDEIIQEMKIRSVKNADDLKAIVGFDQKDNQHIMQTTQAYLIPYPYAEDTRMFGRVRLETPFQGMKYLSPITGHTDSTKHLYIMEGEKDKVGKNKHPLVIVEGEKKTAKVTQELRKYMPDYTAVGIGGVTMWADCPEWREIPISCRKVFIVFDSDWKSKPDVQIQMVKIFLWARKRKANVGIVSFDKGKGIDDHLVECERLEMNIFQEMERLFGQSTIDPAIWNTNLNHYKMAEILAECYYSKDIDGKTLWDEQNLAKAYGIKWNVFREEIAKGYHDIIKREASESQNTIKVEGGEIHKIVEKSDDILQNAGKILKVIRSDSNRDVSFIVAEKGIFRSEMVRNGRKPYEDIRLLCADCVVITERLTDVWGDEAYVKIVWDGHEKIISPDKLNPKNFDVLTRSGLRILSTNAKDMAEYFLFSLNQPELKHSRFASRFGWHQHRFIAGNKIIGESGEDEITVKDDMPCVGEKGDREKWRKLMIRYAIDPQIQIMLGASIISPFISKTAKEGCTVHFFNESSQGKTFGLKLASSLWGVPKTESEFGEGGLIRGWHGTVVGHEIYFNIMNNLPSFLDDSQVAKSSEILFQTIYGYANAAGKTRGTKNLELDKQRSWCGILLSTGERKVSDIMNFTGLAGRSIEIIRKPYEKIEQIEFTKTEFLLSDNYGFGKEAITYYFRNPNQIEERHKKILQEIEIKVRGIFPDLENYKTRSLSKWAAIFLGCEINNELFGIPYNQTAIWEEVMKTLSEMEKKSSENLYDFCMEIYQTNFKHFNEKTPTGYNQTALENEIWGFVDTEKNAILFFKEKLKEMMSMHGYSWSQLAILKENGKLLTTPDRGYCYRVKINNMVQDMVAVIKATEKESEFQPGSKVGT